MTQTPASAPLALVTIPAISSLSTGMEGAETGLTACDGGETEFVLSIWDSGVPLLHDAIAKQLQSKNILYILQVFTMISNPVISNDYF
jgi:hypothetical protein